MKSLDSRGLRSLPTLLVLLPFLLLVIPACDGGGGGGRLSGEPFVVPNYPPPEAVAGEWTCDDWREIANPEGTEEFPPVVAVVEAPDFQIRLHATGRYLVSHMIAREKNGEPFSDEKAALRDIEDGYILYIAAVRDGLGVSEDEARAAVESQTPEPCGVTWEGVSESERVRSAQILRTTIRIVQKMIRERQPGEDIYHLVASRIGEERPNVEITEVAFGAAGKLVCTREDVEVGCPSDLPTPGPTDVP